MRKSLVGIAVILGVCFWIQAYAQESRERVDLSIAHKIRNEAFGRNSKVMDLAFNLTDVRGPRLTGSPEIRKAAEWAAAQMKEWGLTEVKLEPWGPFGRGWSCSRFVAEMKAPEFQPLVGFALPWSPGTHGEVTGEAILAPIATTADFDKFKGKLRGKVVLLSDPRATELPLDPPAIRLTEAQLDAEAEAPEPDTGNPAGLPIGFMRNHPAMPSAGRGGRGGRGNFDRAAARRFHNELNQFLNDEGALVVLSEGGPGAGTVMGQGSYSPDSGAPMPPPSVVVTPEHYNRIARLLEKQIPVTLDFDIQAEFTEPADSFNIVGEIPGTDPNAGVVMLGGHFDSWTGGTGATDNAAGSSVSLEAMRILKTLNLKMRRTVRVGLWTGEEEGLLGSRAYVKAHFADPAEMKPKPEWAKLDGYFNLDNGTGKVRGVYMQDNDEMRPIFEAWIAPFRDLGVTALTIRNTGSTDHMAFDAVGLPGFQFIQDPLDYGTRTHHSNMDVYDELQPNDLEQASAVMAWFAYNAASRPEMLPRKPMPKPEPVRGGRGD
jgi:carboxypeptidase Q